MEPDTLAKILALDAQPLEGSLKEILWHPSTEEQQVLITDIGDSWTTPIINFLSKGTLPTEDREAKKIIQKSANYSFTDGILYKRSYNQLWLRCISTDEGDYILIKIHQGICRAREAADSLSRKEDLQGYF